MTLLNCGIFYPASSTLIIHKQYSRESIKKCQNKLSKRHYKTIGN